MLGGAVRQTRGSSKRRPIPRWPEARAHYTQQSVLDIKAPGAILTLRTNVCFKKFNATHNASSNTHGVW